MVQLRRNSNENSYPVLVKYWRKKNKFVSMTGGYHGDTFGAMSVGFSSGFISLLKMLFKNNFLFFS